MFLLLMAILAIDTPVINAKPTHCYEQGLLPLDHRSPAEALLTEKAVAQVEEDGWKCENAAKLPVACNLSEDRLWVEEICATNRPGSFAALINSSTPLADQFRGTGRIWFSLEDGGS